MITAPADSAVGPEMPLCSHRNSESHRERLHTDARALVCSAMGAAWDVHVDSTVVTTLNSQFGHLLGEELVHPFVHSPHEAVLLTVLADGGRGPDLRTKRAKR